MHVAEPARGRVVQAELTGDLAWKLLLCLGGRADAGERHGQRNSETHANTLTMQTNAHRNTWICSRNESTGIRMGPCTRLECT